MRVHTVDRERDDAVVILRTVRTEHVHVRHGQHAREGVGRQVVLALLGALPLFALLFGLLMEQVSVRVFSRQEV